MPCRRRFFLPKHSGNRVPQRLDHYSGLTSVYSKWTPPATTTYHQFLARLDGSGGAAVIETDNPADITETAGKFAFMLDYQVVPVVDIADGIQAMIAGIDFLESVP